MDSAPPGVEACVRCALSDGVSISTTNVSPRYALHTTPVCANKGPGGVGWWGEVPHVTAVYTALLVLYCTRIVLVLYEKNHCRGVARRGTRKRNFPIWSSTNFAPLFLYLRPCSKKTKGRSHGESETEEKNKMLLIGRRPLLARPFQTAVQHAHRIQQQPWGE